MDQSTNAHRKPGKIKPADGTAQARLEIRRPEVAQALKTLAADGKVTGSRSAKISARVDPAVFSAAADRLGLPESGVSDVVNAALAIAAAPDQFKAWWRDPGPKLPDDFELAI